MFGLGIPELVVLSLIAAFAASLFFAFGGSKRKSASPAREVKENAQETTTIQKPSNQKEYVMDNTRAQRILVMPTKSMGLSIILTILFGPLGMFYSTIWGGVIMGILTFIVGLVTLGIGLIIMWPICVIWGAVATNAYNKKIMES